MTNKPKCIRFHRGVRYQHKLIPNQSKKAKFPFGTIKKKTKIKTNDKHRNALKM